MAKLYFRYGAMNSGKSTSLLQAAYNYEERGQHVLLAKPAIDTKGADEISSRLGMSRDRSTSSSARTTTLRDAVRRAPRARAARRRGLARARSRTSTPVDVACLLIDEAQFLTPRAGRRPAADRRAGRRARARLRHPHRLPDRAFPGSRRLLELAHTLEELKTICRCGRKAIFNARLVGGRFVFDGDQVAIDELSARPRHLRVDVRRVLPAGVGRPPRLNPPACMV